MVANGAVVNIVGAGLAGLSAARTLASQGVASRLVSAQASERAQSVLAEGGINAALDLMGEHDGPEQHFADTMAGGVWLADPNAVWGLVSDAPAIVRDLVALGVPFAREGGRMIQRNFGGQKKKRTAYADTITGKALVSALIDDVRKCEAQGLVERLPHHELADIVIDKGTCAGVWVRDAYAGSEEYLPGLTILATGGMGGMFYGLTTGTTTNTGDVAALALARGVELANLEFVQYHPTTLPIVGKRLLVTEAARGEGGRLFVLRGGEPFYFMEERYPELGNLMPRDVVSREEHAVLADPSLGDCIYLDMRSISRRVWHDRLSDLREEIVHYVGIDPTREPISVEPGIHYCMGGVLVDEEHRTNVDGLYAAGECACAYHGANRLGGNSLLGAIRGGMVAARTASCATPSQGGRPTNPGATPSQGERPTNPGATPSQGGRPTTAATEHAMQQALRSCMGIVRTGDKLRAAQSALDALPHTARVNLARAIVACALARTESRGAHQRADFPFMNDAFRRTTVVNMANDAPQIELRPLPQPRREVPTP